MGNMVNPPPAEFTAQQVMDDPVLRYFHYAHLPEPLRSISESFCTLAAFLVTAVPRNAERTVALRKLLEAKDAGVRANVATPIPSTYKTRLADEFKALAEKIDRLGEFMIAPKFHTLPAQEQTDLHEQYQSMQAYRGILERRINRSNNLGFEAGRPSTDGEIKVTGGDKAETPIPFD